jgi:sulfur carrier protein ThiS
MHKIVVDVWLYGPLACYGDNKNSVSFANCKVELSKNSSLKDLLNHLNLPTEERGITFINGKLTAMPGIQPDLDSQLEEGDRIALFHLKSMWPFQYRDGASLGKGLEEAFKKDRRPFHQRPK